MTQTRQIRGSVDCMELVRRQKLCLSCVGAPAIRRKRLRGVTLENGVCYVGTPPREASEKQVELSCGTKQGPRVDSVIGMH